MARIAEIVVLFLPVLLVALLFGLGATIAVFANEGRGRSNLLSRVAGTINMVIAGLLMLVAVTAEARDVRGMFLFSAIVFILIGVFGLRAPTRFRD